MPRFNGCHSALHCIIYNKLFLCFRYLLQKHLGIKREYVSKTSTFQALRNTFLKFVIDVHLKTDSNNWQFTAVVFHGDLGFVRATFHVS